MCVAGPDGSTADGATDGATDVAMDVAAEGSTDSGISCTAPMGNCDNDPGNGCETDLTSNGQHCGACEHDCFGGTCTNGQCEPVMIAENLDSPWLVVADRDGVYWAAAGKAIGFEGVIYMSDLDGSNAVQLATGQHWPFMGLAVDEHHVYWTNYGKVTDRDGTVMRVAKVGGTAEVVAGGLSGPKAVAVDATHVYWTNNDGTVTRAVKDGSSPLEVLAQQASGKPLGIVVDGTNVYWDSTAGEIFSVPLAGGTTQTLTTNQGAPRFMTADLNHVYWVSQSGDVTDAGGFPVISRIGKSGGSAEIVALSSDTGGYDIDMDTTHVYWTNFSTGEVLRVSLQDSGIETLADGQGWPRGIALDDTSVYWAAQDDGRIMRLAK